jgi:hypothetical protein
MQRVAQKRAWGTDDPARKGGDYFGARAAANLHDLIPTQRSPADPIAPREPPPP